LVKSAKKQLTRKVDQKYMESLEMWCWRRMEKISWTDRVRNEVLCRVKEDTDILHKLKRRKANWIGHILLSNCLLKHIIEEKKKGKEIGRRGRRSKQLLNAFQNMIRYWKLKEEVLDRAVWRICFRRRYGPVVRQTA
jgi:hypothetical protein